MKITTWIEIKDKPDSRVEGTITVPKEQWEALSPDQIAYNLLHVEREMIKKHVTTGCKFEEDDDENVSSDQESQDTDGEGETD